MKPTWHRQSTSWPVLLLLLSCPAPQLLADEIRVIERGPNHSVVQRLSTSRDTDGTWTTQTNSWTQLEDGLNYWDPDTGQWEESREEILLDRVGAVAARGQHRVLFSPNANDPTGAVDFEVARKARFRASLLALRYFDPISGRDAIIAMAKDAQGELLPPNQVIYRDVLDGVKASLVFTYRKNGLESDLVLNEIPPSPEDYDIPPEVARIEVVTEFFEAPEPTRRTNVLDRVADPVLRSSLACPDWIDEELDFQDSRIGLGRAFAWSDRHAATVHPEAFPAVGKRWVSDNTGRRALIESVDYQQVINLLINLPGSEARRATVQTQARRWANNPSTQPRLTRALAKRTGLKGDPIHTREAPSVAATTLPRRTSRDREPGADYAIALATDIEADASGLVLDWTSITAGSNNMTFRTDETYLIAGHCWFYQTTVFQGGSVIKFTNSAYPHITITGPLLFNASAARPVVFTSLDDNSVGESLVPGSPNPTVDYAWINLRIKDTGVPVVVEHARFKHASLGLYFSGNNPSNTVRHSQFIHCLHSIAMDTSTLVRVQNCLIHSQRQGTAFLTYGATAPPLNVIGEHLTLSALGSLRSPGSLVLSNSILVGVTNIQAFDGGNNYVSSTIPPGLFSPNGAGGFYLASNSPHRNAGTTNIDASLAAELRQLTTEAPQQLIGVVRLPTLLAPQARRDTDLPDLGYHYPPIDFLVSALVVTNTSLTIAPGTTVAVLGPSGFVLQPGARFSMLGHPTSRAKLVRYNCIQEGMDPTGTTSGSTFDFLKLEDLNATGSAIPSVTLHGASISHLAITPNNSSGRRLFQASAGFPVHPLSIAHSELHGIYLNNSGPTADNRSTTLTNNLFEACSVVLYDTPGSASLSVAAYNNLFLGGSLPLQNWGPTTWSLADNLFASSSLSTNGTGAFAFGNNGFAAGVSPLGSNAKTNLSLGFVTGPLGPFYYPTNGAANSLTNLFDAGSRSREAASLFHFTTKATPGSKEGAEPSPTVDIGYHYAGVDTTGRTLDTDGDGLPDAVEDANGNGLADPGESSWTAPNSGLSGSASLLLFTPVR